MTHISHFVLIACRLLIWINQSFALYSSINSLNIHVDNLWPYSNQIHINLNVLMNQHFDLFNKCKFFIEIFLEFNNETSMNPINFQFDSHFFTIGSELSYYFQWLFKFTPLVVNKATTDKWHTAHTITRYITNECNN